MILPGGENHRPSMGAHYFATCECPVSNLDYTIDKLETCPCAIQVFSQVFSSVSFSNQPQHFCFLLKNRKQTVHNQQVLQVYLGLILNIDSVRELSQGIIIRSNLVFAFFIFYTSFFHHITPLLGQSYSVLKDHIRQSKW